jgi:sporulation protein YlmC with PRC-barrel domain
MDKHEYGAIKSNYIIGKNVLSADNENLGKIEDIVLDKKSGQVLYVVLSFGDFMGLDKLYALPWDSINYDVVEQGFKLMINKEALTSATCFQNNQWTDFSEPVFHKPVTTNGLS